MAERVETEAGEVGQPTSYAKGYTIQPIARVYIFLKNMQSLTNKIDVQRLKITLQ